MWIVPTYRRPAECRRFLDSCTETGVSTSGIVVINGTDPAYDGLVLPAGWTTFTLPENVGFNAAVAAIFAMHPDEPWYGIVTDDHIPRTAGWDAKLIEIAGQKAIASSDDGWQAPGRMHGAFVIPGGFARAVGRLTPPCFHHFMDDLWEQVGRAFNCWRVDMSILVEHMHPGIGKAQTDANYHENPTHLNADAEIFGQYVRAEGQGIMARVAEFLGAKLRSFDITGRKVMICTPAYGGKVGTQYLQNVVETVTALGAHKVGCGISVIPDESLVARARNNFVKRFMESDFTHLLFIDADMGWHADAVLRLLMADKDLVAAAGCRKNDQISFCINFDGHKIVACPDTGCVRANEVGSGFMMISRGCLEKMIAAYPQTKYKDLVDSQEYHALFDSEIGDGTWWSEDYTFCRRWRRAGGDVWVDPHIHLQHIGNKVYEGALVQMLSDKPKAVSA